MTTHYDACLERIELEKCVQRDTDTVLFGGKALKRHIYTSMFARLTRKALIFNGGRSWPGPEPSAKREIQGRV